MVFPLLNFYVHILLMDYLWIKKLLDRNFILSFLISWWVIKLFLNLWEKQGIYFVLAFLSLPLFMPHPRLFPSTHLLQSNVLHNNIKNVLGYGVTRGGRGVDANTALYIDALCIDALCIDALCIDALWSPNKIRRGLEWLGFPACLTHKSV